MNQNKTSFKKTLVRNTEEPVPKSIVINEIDDLIEKNEPIKHKTKSSHSLAKTNLSTPIIQSTHCVTKQISSLDNVRPRKIKSLSDVDKKNKLAIDEKLTRKVNFRYDQPIYKDLIPLHIKPQTTIAPLCREAQPLKDKEPNLNDFCRQRMLPEYKYQVPVLSIESTPVKGYDGLSLHRLINSWTK